MKKLVLVGALVFTGAIALQDVSIGHGGTYRGPGDTVPPGGGGGGGGGTGPSGPGASGPSTGGPSGPSTPTPGGPGGTTGGGRPGAPSTGGGSQGPDLETWEYWWGFNKDPYLNLKAAIYAGTTTNSDDFWLGKDASNAKNALKPSEEAVRTKIVPALKEALEKERANDIVTGCLIALAKIGDKKSDDGSSEFEGIIAKFLKDPSQEIAETAAIALGVLANDASVQTLTDLATDSGDGRKLVGKTEVPYRSRAFATYGLALIGNKTTNNETRQQIARVLVDLLSKPESSTRDIKVAAIIALGLVPIDVDPGEGADGKGDVTASRQSQIKYLQKFFTDQNNHYQIRAHAPTAIARLLAPPGSPVEMKDSVCKMLLEALEVKNTKEDVVRSCVLALGQLGDTDKDKIDVEIRAALRKATTEADRQSRNFSMISMAQIGGRAGKGDGNEDGQKDCRTHLLSSLTGSKNHLRPWAGMGVGVMERALKDASLPQSASAKETLRTSLKGEGAPEILGAYAIAAGIAQDLEAKEILRGKLKDTSEQNAKGFLCVSLGLMGARDSLKEIQDIVRDSKYKPELLKQSAIGLGLLGDKELVPELVKMLEEAKALSSQASLASALGFIGDSRSIDPLVAMIKRKDLTESARGFAAVALGIVADKELLPWNSKLSVNLNYRANTSTLTGEGKGVLDIF